MNREDIHIISKHSNWSENGVKKALKDNVYSDPKSWRKFLKLLFISLGVGFATSGIIFFFAYNWSDLHKFVKIGMIEGLIVLTSSFVLFSKFKPGIKNVILTGTAVLVGVLFAVFGQVYQTGANAYDFFLGWTVFITLWVVVSNFPALWLVYLLLINTTLVLYSQQVAHQWSDIFVINLLFVLNTIVLIFFIWLSENKKMLIAPNWFKNIIALAAISFSTFGITYGIFERYKVWFLILIIISATSYAAGIIYGIKTKSGFYLSIIPFSLIIIISAFLIDISHDEAMLLFISLFIIASVTLVIKNLITLQKKINE